MEFIRDITEFIFLRDEPQRSDVIFLPGGSVPEQPEYAAKLYREGFAEWVFPSGGLSVKLEKWPGVRSKADVYTGDYHTDCEFYTDVLIKNGVPPEAILKEDTSGYTKANAFFSRKVADELGLHFRTAIIVCKSFHARRCQMFYQLAFPQTQLRICPVDSFGVSRENWFTSAYGIGRVLGELSRCGNQCEDEIKGLLLGDCSAEAPVIPD